MGTWERRDGPGRCHVATKLARGEKTTSTTFATASSCTVAPLSALTTTTLMGRAKGDGEGSAEGWREGEPNIHPDRGQRAFVPTE